MQTNWNWLPIFSKNGEGFYDLNKMKDVIDPASSMPKSCSPPRSMANSTVSRFPVTAPVFYFNDETRKSRASPSRKPGMS